MSRAFMLLLFSCTAIASCVAQKPASNLNQAQARTYSPGDHITFTVHLDGVDAKKFKFDYAALSYLGVIPLDKVASNYLGDPIVTTPAAGVYLLTFTVGEHTYPGDYSLLVMFESDDGTLLFPWDTESSGIAAPVHILNPRPLQRPTVRVEGLSAEKGVDLPRVESSGAAFRFTPADVAYMQGMIMHHGQAVDMCNLIPSHTDNQKIRELGSRIGIPQAREILFMRKWLRSRGQSIQMARSEAMVGMPGMDMSGTMMSSMPGMLTAAQMKTLDNAHGQEFDKLFLSGMVQHHEGALVMTDDLFASPGGGQGPLCFFAKQLVIVQKKEIALMKSMQQEIDLR